MQNGVTTRVLVLADTHLRGDRTGQLVTLLAPHLELADVIVHAGDITDHGLLDDLRRFAPVHAVLGNNDVGLDLPERLTLEVDGVRLGIVHDSGPAKGRGPRLASWFPDADVVVFGHSHLPWHERLECEGRFQIHFNPGSPTQRRRAPSRTIGWMVVDAGGQAVCSHVEV
ncbi:MAG: metallophosphoesterase family protein [Acidimicrobiales bacterium]